LSGIYCWKFKKIAKSGFGRKNQLSPQCVYIAKFKFFQFEGVENKECVHSRANGTCYTSATLISLE
jgi:hypothetical protein